MLSILARILFIMAYGFLGPIDFTIVYDFMILVLSCHAYVFLSVHYSYCSAITAFSHCNVIVPSLLFVTVERVS